MKEFKYTIDGQEYTVQIEGVEGNIASLNVNGEAFKVEMEKEAEPEKKKVVLGQPAAEQAEGETTSAANVNTANALKAPLPGVVIFGLLERLGHVDRTQRCFTGEVMMRFQKFLILKTRDGLKFGMMFLCNMRRKQMELL